MSKKNRRSTVSQKRLFLDALERGSDVREAASYAGVSRATPYNWAKADLVFKAAWEKAESVASGELRRKAYEMALGGNVRMLTWLLERIGGSGEDDGRVAEIQIIGLKEGESYAGDFIEFVERR